MTGVPIVDDHALLPGDSVAITASRSADRLEVRYTLTADREYPASGLRPGN